VNLFLWILQGLLAAAFAGAGVMKLTQPVEKLGKQMTWVPRFSVPTVRFVGAVEALGAIGLILPWATGIAKVLTPLAAVGLAVTMVLAAIHHLQHKEPKQLPTNVILFAFAVVIAIGRFAGL
jgi:uncharacterized membrane protein YphA (DoxX/SURF4 family)